MGELERILKLLSQGRIGREEAERLLAALEADRTEAFPAREAAGRLHLSANFAEVEVHPVAGDRVVADASGAGTLELTQEENEARLRFDSQGGVRLGPLRIGPKGSRLSVGLPRGWAVSLKLGMGSFRAENLAALEGNVGKGEVEVGRLSGLDLKIGMGDFSAGLLLQDGEHRLLIGLGRATLRPLPGADFRLSVHIGSGAAESRAFGGGRAVLQVRIGRGALEVADERGT